MELLETLPNGREMIYRNSLHKVKHEKEDQLIELLNGTNLENKLIAHQMIVEDEELIASLRRLGDLVQRQLKDILDAYLKKSKELAIKIWKTDEKVDDLTHTAMNEVADFLGKDKKNLDLATHLLFVTKNIERAGDHITNIAESLFYLIEGEHIEGARPKGKDFDSNS